MLIAVYRLCATSVCMMLSHEFRLWVITYILAEAVSGLERWSTHGSQHLNIKKIKNKSKRTTCSILACLLFADDKRILI